MWEPPPPSPDSSFQSKPQHDEFQLCKSAFRLGEFDCTGGNLLVSVCSSYILVLVSLAVSDSDSEEDEPHFYLANESHGRTQHSAHPVTHNLSLLSLTVIINKGRIQARTDKKVDEKPETRGPFVTFLFLYSC